jgi:hypothetical protein
MREYLDGQMALKEQAQTAKKAAADVYAQGVKVGCMLYMMVHVAAHHVPQRVNTRYRRHKQRHGRRNKSLCPDSGDRWRCITVSS